LKDISVDFYKHQPEKVSMSAIETNCAKVVEIKARIPDSRQQKAGKNFTWFLKSNLNLHELFTDYHRKIGVAWARIIYFRANSFRRNFAFQMPGNLPLVPAMAQTRVSEITFIIW